MSGTKLNPLIAAAAVSVIVFSAAGVGVMTGLIPSSKSSSDALTPAESKPTASTQGNAVPLPEAPAARAPQSQPGSKSQKPAVGAPPMQPPQQFAMNEPTAAAVPPPPPPGATAAMPVPAPAPAPVCKSCGVVDGINVVEKKGSGGPIGVVGGAVVGGLLGNQVGRGHGNTAATVIGAVGGAVAGNEVEKRVNSAKEYRVTVRMDDGNVRHFTYHSAPPYAAGERVKVVNGQLSRG
jgi:outer membrane lipoprotein SlyB